MKTLWNRSGIVLSLVALGGAVAACAADPTCVDTNTCAGAEAGGGSETGGSGGSDVGGSGGTSGSSSGGTASGGVGGSDPGFDCEGSPDGTACDAMSVCIGGVCRVSVCGDGVTDNAQGETCDDGMNGNDDDGCTDDCAATCGADSDCDDGNVCNGTETCADGVCQVGTARSCDDGLPCTTDSCDSQTGACVYEPKSDGTSCTVDRLCIDAQCVESSCGDGYVDETAGEECDEMPNGDDADGCKDDCTFTCKADSDCVTDACHTGSTCDQSTHTCTTPTPIDCSDNDPCTADSCDPNLGCTSTFIDVDGDGAGAGATCGNDCDDNDADVFPGQTKFFTTPRPNGSYDYNCDGDETTKYRGLFMHLVCNDGWHSRLYQCGETGTYAYQCAMFPDAQGNLSCNCNYVYEETQACN